jgi:hypothetical protein
LPIIVLLATRASALGLLLVFVGLGLVVTILKGGPLS